MGTQQSDYIWLDGELLKWEAATVHVLAHTLHYGLGAFEGIRCYERHDGRVAVFRLSDHISRLLASCKIASIDPPFTHEQLMAACVGTIKANKLKACYVRPIIYLGTGGLGLGSLSNKISTAVVAYEWGAYLGDKGLQDGIRCMVSSFRRGAVDAISAKGKICGQYVGSILAKRDALRNGYDEAIMLDQDGLVAEGTGENIFIVNDGIVYTPPTSAAILNGITRDSIITLCRQNNIEVREQSFARDQLWTADEAFFTGSAAEVTPIREVDGRLIGTGKPGEVTRRLQDSFFAAVKGPNESRHEAWLTFV